MDKTLAHYSFLPWVRQGLGNQITEEDTLGNGVPTNPVLERPEVIVSTEVKAFDAGGGTHNPSPISKPVKIQGPGDVLGINQKSVIRVHPKKDVTNFETNNLAYVEFYEEDLPWRFTPASPKANKLRPWLALIVLREDEFTQNNTGATPTPFISIVNKNKLAGIFCNEKDISALAHVHVLQDLGNDSNTTEAEALQNILAQNPDLALSRVICPRKLTYSESGNNTYHAFLIPAFETGRQAGMGEDTSATPAQQASWIKANFNSNNHPLNYPYYYSWTFQVGPNGDFESLAQLLEARELPEKIGKREMDLHEMGFGIEPELNDDVIGFVEGAMRHPNYATAPWPVSDQSLKTEFRKILNISADLQDTVSISQNETYFYSPYIEEDPIIAPPTYGKWHAGTFKLQNGKNDWVHDLNMHPTHRAAAGLGTRVVQQNQEQFMEMAWEQIGQINEANQKIIESEMAKRMAEALKRKKIDKLKEVDLMNVAGGTLNVLKLDDGFTAKKSLVDSRIPTAMRSGAFTKVANNFTPTAIMNNGQDGATEVLKQSLIERLNEDEKDAQGKINTNKISAAPVRKEPISLLPVVDAFNAIQSVVLNPPKTFMQNLADAIKKNGGANFDPDVVLNKLADASGEYKFDTQQMARATDIIKPKIGASVSAEEGIDIEVVVAAEKFTQRISETYDEGVYDRVKFKKQVFGEVQEIVQFNHALVLENRLDFKVKFETFFPIQTVNNNIVVQQFVRFEPSKLVLPDFRNVILTRLNPFLTYLRRLNAFFETEQENLSKPIMAYPRFPIPMYDYLKEISPDYIIPNVSEIEPNTMTLMEPNKAFIESFLTGMNHEFSRELLWREFPTDMRGSYFRHFWEYDNDPSAEIEPGESVEDYTNRILNLQETSADIHELHKWKVGNSLKRLGDNHVGGPELVLLIKGELFKKYPNTLVYAQKAKFDPNGKNKPRLLSDYEGEDNVMWPIITGKLEPDVYFFGFELTEEEANGNRTNNPGWFFVLRERPGQISFGLDDLDDENSTSDPLLNWNQVTWEHITGNDNTQPKHLRIHGKSITLDDLPNNVDENDYEEPRDASWSKNSADMAYILYQPPILFARHASTMLTD